MFLKLALASIVAYLVFHLAKYFLWCRKLSQALSGIKGVSDNPHMLWGDLSLVRKSGGLAALRAEAFARLFNERFLKAYLGPMPVLMCRDYGLFKYVMSNQSGSSNPFLRVHSVVINILLGQHSIILLDGAEWALHRATLFPLLNHKKISQSVEFANRLYERLQRLWDIECAAQSTKSQSAVINFEQYASQLAAGMIIYVAFSVDVGVLNTSADVLPPVMEKLERAQNQIERLLRMPPFMANWPTPARIQLSRLCREAGQEFQVIINQRREQIRGDGQPGSVRCPDAFDLMLNPSVKPPFSDAAVHDGMVSLAWAGHRPASLFMTFCVYCLGKYPQHQERIYEEVGDLPRPFANDHIVKCAFLQSFMNEVLRFISIAPVVLRQSSTDQTWFEGVQFPKGLWIMNSIYDMHHDPEYFDRPDEFDPDRNLSGNPKFMPFSMGEKKCLGMKLARAETRSFIAAIVRDYRIDLLPDANYTIQYHFLSRPAAGMMIRIHKRNN